MPKRTDLQKVGTLASAVTPARHVPKLVKVLAPTGASIMIFDNITQDNLIAMLVAIIVTAIAFLAINYLAEYRDWKYTKQLEYEDALNKLGNKADKPDLAFSYVYIVSLIVSLVLVSVVAAFIVPLAVKFFVYDEVLAVEPSTYFFVAFAVTAVLALFIDKAICRPLADGSFKAKESAVEEEVIEELEQKFQTGGSVALSTEAQAKLMAAIADVLKQQKQ